MSNPITDPRDLLESAPMGRLQILAVGLTVILSALDGYDVLSTSLVVPAIALAWGGGKAEALCRVIGVLAR